jgi:hypothetical protein
LNAIAVGDLNGDNRADIIATTASTNSINVFLALGDGIFTSKISFSVGNNPFDVTLADFNGDGRQDVAVTNNANSTVGILLNICQ